MSQKGGVKIKPAKRDKLRFNLLVVGESGIGKTTFLEALLRRYVENITVDPADLPIGEKTLKIEKVGKFEVSTETGDGLVYTYYLLYCT
jgi:septin family protein